MNRNSSLNPILILIIILAAMLWVLLLTRGDFFRDKLALYLLGQANFIALQKIENPEPILYKPIQDYELAVTGAVEKAIPSVVSVSVSKDVPVIGECIEVGVPSLPPEFRSLFPSFRSEIVRPCEKGSERKEVGGGSGFAIDGGYIVTNKHVVSDKKAEYKVRTSDGKEYKAKVIALDPTLDLGIIKITDRDLPPLKLGDSDGVKLGQTAIAIGNALGKFANTISVGVVSGLSRNIVAQDGSVEETLEDVLQTDAAINRGNSGGPLINLKGEVIAINIATSNSGENIGFALPINQVKRSLKSLRENGRIITPFLGVYYVIVDEDLKKKEKLTVDHGVLIRNVDGSNGPAIIPNSPAKKAGLKVGDIITTVNGTVIDEKHSLMRLISAYSVGETLTLKVLRAGKELELKVTLEERPEKL